MEEDEGLRRKLTRGESTNIYDVAAAVSDLCHILGKC